MGRSKSIARRSKPVRETTTIGFHEPWPVEFINQLHTLLTNSEDQSQGKDAAEPPSKRVKRYGTDAEALLVAKEELELVRKCPEGALVDGPQRVCRRNIGPDLRFWLSRSKELRIDARRQTDVSSINAAVAIQPNIITDRLAACLDVFVRHWTKTTREGELWVSLDATASTQGGFYKVSFYFNLYWNETKSPYCWLRSSVERKLSQQILDIFLPDVASSSSTNRGQESWSPLDFYEAAHVPASNDKTALSIEVPELTASLYPYQKKTVQWLLRREGVRWNGSNPDSIRFIEDLPAPQEVDGAHSFRKIRDELGTGMSFYVSNLYHVITTDLGPFQHAEQSVRGGILAEEMGLGKTLEIIGLIALHRRPPTDDIVYTKEGEELITTGATLIVTPDSLKQQWIEELERHAPHLHVKYYPGRKNVNFSTEEELRADLAAHDVVITTYPVLSAEVHFAMKAPERSRRQERKYERAGSPLTKISWWRVCLDEAQMIESGVTGAAAVARLLPRINAWGVTGTPVKNDVKDLYGLLDFLRYEPYASSPQIWRSLTESHKPLFRSLFGSIALRHTKQLVRHEIVVPPQKRFVITLPFTAVEEQYYTEMFKNMARRCGVDILGAPLQADWVPEVYENEMRTWLNRLRQAALHPEIVQRRGTGRKVGPMRTVEEVLDAMIEQSDNDIRTDHRAYLQARLTHGQMLENSPRVSEALEIWKRVKEDAIILVAECRKELEAVLDEVATIPRSTISGQAQEARGNASASDDIGEDGGDDGANNARVGEARTKLRHALEVLHKATFFCANAFFQIKSNTDMTEPDSDQFRRLQQLEDAEYGKAQEIRREILSESHTRAMSLMKKLERQAQNQSFVEMPELVFTEMRGLESGPTLEMLEELCGILNEQANRIDEWREAVIKLLCQPLIDEEAEAEITGEEFTDSTKIQEELIVYVQILRAAIADRQGAISGLGNALVKHEMRVSVAAAENGDGPAPEKLLALYRLRDEVKPSPDKHGSLRRVIADLRAIASRLPKDGAGGRAGTEREIVYRQITATQTYITSQAKAATALEREVDRFTNSMNARVEYYRQLQAVSDSVAPYEGSNDDQAIAACVMNEERYHNKLDSDRAKHRYLLNLKAEGGQSNEPRWCIICQAYFMTGILTICGHEFCRDCLKQWYRAHHNCPMCKRKLRLTELHDITLKPRELKMHEDIATGPSFEVKKNQAAKASSIYSHFSSEKLAQINDVELDSLSFGTKVDTLVRHVLWLRESDPGAKSIVFTQYKSFLEILGAAFDRYKIGFSTIDRPNGVTRFKEDPGIECFMLHGRANSSGLNLVNASHVFLCEPLLNTALELQAIARVDRIGQKNETTVWLYLIEGSVEESIYNLSVKRRMEHMGQSSKGKSKGSTPEIQEPTLEAANTLELEQASLSRLMSRDKNAGEAVPTEDLWECLFGQVSRRITSGVTNSIAEDEDGR
ncbi:SNF2 family domain-containing protein [Colletotrichum sublineola]|uniref:Putative SNF2 family domain-containing protein n=1 Tax=Colletotrichum sublineola TaxID=1173701 RepID=A0A066X8Y1_COLSU|nr:SNF2 family domain-containing protein [Colletotrichum sublineola]KDN62490.1 putative SNF2 family domain-containing protein [Colletotrichum sublineola]